MIAKDILSNKNINSEKDLMPTVNSDMAVIDVLPRLLDIPERQLAVTEDGTHIGIIDEASLLEGLGRMIAPRDDCSLITIECAPEDYSASLISHAVEDAEAHLVDLFTVPSENGNLNVTLRVRLTDPTAAERSLERYGFNVVDSSSSSNRTLSVEIATERLLSLQALMNV